MKASALVDEVGRMVLPKSIRDAMGISGRMTVQIEIVSGAAQISITQGPPGALVRRRGRTVYGGELPADWDSAEAVSRMRERRLRN